MTGPNLTMMERHLDNTVRAAIEAQKRFNKARRAAGLKGRRAIYTAAEVKALRLEWYDQWRGMLRAMHDPKLLRLAKVAIGAMKQAKAASQSAQVARGILEAGEKRRNLSR